MIRSFRDLKVWQKSISLVLDIYGLTRKFPKDELYGLVSQMRRCAVSMPSNIAEGYCRKTKTEYIQYLHIAFGSSGELETQLIIAKNLEYLASKDFDIILTKLIEIRKMLYSLMKKLKHSVA